MMLQWALETTLICGLLALVVALICRFNQHKPALCHILWVLVLVRLILPPLPLPSLLDKLPSPIQQPSEVGETPRLEVVTRPAKDRGDVQEQEEAYEEAGIWAESENALLLPEQTVSGAIFDVRWLLYTWLLGSFLVLTVQFRRMTRFNKVLKFGAAAGDELAREIRNVAQRMNIKAPHTLTFRQIDSPVVWGFGKPVLLWPASLATFTRNPGARSVLAHELAHLKRKDHWISWLEYLGMGLLWWHPLFWMVRHRIRNYSELACDAWAVWAYPKQKREYASALIDAVSPVLVNPKPVTALAATHSERRTFERRLTMIMRGRTTPRISTLWLIPALVLIVPFLPSLSQKSGLEQMMTLQSTGDRALDDVVSARILVRRAKVQMKTDDWSAATESLRELVKFRPEDAKAHRHLGMALLEAGRNGEAVESFRRVTRLDANSGSAWYNLARAQAETSPGTALESLKTAVRKGYMNAENLMDDAFASLSDRPAFDALLKTSLGVAKLKKEAEEAFGDEDWDTVVAKYNRVLEMMPDFAHGYTRLAYAQITGGMYEDALETLGTQMDMEYRMETALYNHACVYALTGEADRAMDYLKRAVDAGFDNPKHLEKDSDLNALRDTPAFDELMADLNARHEDYKAMKKAMKSGDHEALARLSKDLGDDHGHIHDTMGLTLLSKDDLDGAETAFRKQILAEHDVDRALYNLACVHSRKGNMDKAFNYLRNAVATGFDNVNHMKKDSDLEALRKDQRFEQFVGDVQDAHDLANFGVNSWTQLEDRSRAAIAKNSESGKAWHQLGWSLLRQADYDGAAEAFRKQAEQGHRTETAYYNVACSYAAKGDNAQAFQYLKQAIGEGFDNARLLATDPDLDGLREDADFQKLLKVMKKNHGHDDDHHKDHDKHDHYEGHEEHH